MISFHSDALRCAFSTFGMRCPPFGGMNLDFDRMKTCWQLLFSDHGSLSSAGDGDVDVDVVQQAITETTLPYNGTTDSRH